MVIFGGMPTLSVGDMGELPDGLPVFLLPDVPLNLETLQIILPTAVALALVGLLESLLTAFIVDDFSDTPSDKNREAQGQGIANIATGFLDGMAGCAMIGQSVINVKSGGQGRLSTLSAGVFLLFLIVVLGDVVSMIPMAALVAVMLFVSFATFDWQSIPSLRRLPRTDATVLIVTVAVDKFITAFDYSEKVNKVVIDLRHAWLWDSSAIAGIDKVVSKFRRNGIEVEVLSPEGGSGDLHDKLALHDKGKDIGIGH